MYAVVYTLGGIVRCVNTFDTYEEACNYTLTHVRIWRNLGLEDVTYMEKDGKCCGIVAGDCPEVWVVMRVGVPEDYDLMLKANADMEV